MASRLTILEQQACLIQSQLEEGEETQTHVVVRRTPFRLELAVNEESEIDFKNSRLECALMFDLPAPKEVTLADGAPPLSFVARPSADFKSCQVDMRVNMLTTQANGVRFLIEARLQPLFAADELVKVKLEPSADEALVVWSKPIVVVSKQQQVRNRATGKEPHHVRANKRARTEDLLGTLQEILSSQQEHRDELASLYAAVTKQQRSKSSSAGSTLTSSGAALASSGSAPRSILSLSGALNQLLEVYRNEGTQRQQKLARVTSDADVTSRGLMREVGFVLSADFYVCDVDEIKASFPVSLSSDEDEHLLQRATLLSHGQDDIEYDDPRSAWAPEHAVDDY